MTTWIDCTDCPCLSDNSDCDEEECNLGYTLVKGHTATLSSINLKQRRTVLSVDCKLSSIKYGENQQYVPKETDLFPITYEEYWERKREQKIKQVIEDMGGLSDYGL